MAKISKRCILTQSVQRHIFILSFEYDLMVLLTLARVYGGQWINGQSVLFHAPHEFLKVYKINK